jgi:hypothetical protein
VSPGDRSNFVVTHLGRKAEVQVQLQPTRYRDGNGFGIAVKKEFETNSDGKAVVQFRWPQSYFAGDDRVRWEDGEKADVNVCSTDRADIDCARDVVRVQT